MEFKQQLPDTADQKRKGFMTVAAFAPGDGDGDGDADGYGGKVVFGWTWTS